MTITWGDTAYDDLDRIAHYLANLSPEAVEKTINPHPERCPDGG